MEIFKNVFEFENYQISTKGVLKKNLKYRKGREYQEIFLNPVTDKDGYYRTVLSNLNCKKNVIIHRLVAKAFIPNPENKPQVNHINGIKTDNRVENLEWCTAQENTIHSYKIRLQKPKKRELHNMSKLSECDISAIRKNECKLSQRELGLIYGVCQAQISRIINFNRWS